MSKHKKHKSPNKGANKDFAARRTMNPPQAPGHQGSAGQGNASQEHDAARRMGSFEGAGEHARTGNPGHQ